MIDRYEHAAAGARSAAIGRNVFMKLAECGSAEHELVRLVVAFCSNARLLTESVDSWTRRSGEQCVALGHVELGELLQLDADRQESRHAALVETSRHLTQRTVDETVSDQTSDRWEASGRGLGRYVELNEALIEEHAPFSKVAVEFEVERLSAAFWTRLHAALGDVEHSAFPELGWFVRTSREDAAHRSWFYGEQVRTLLFRHPETFDELISAGRSALDCFGEFLDDCWVLAVRTSA